MAIRSFLSLFCFFFLLFNAVHALQVTPGSGCATLCLDDGRTDGSDPSASNTFTTDIVCQDNDYNQTSVGRKYRDCLSCLQSSSAAKLGETDQGWFIYNLRFAASSCLFDFSNSTTEVCASDATCASLQKFLQEGSLDPTKNTWAYCMIGNDPFLGVNLGQCMQCLRQTENSKYLANFLVGLQAGCTQRPSPQVLVGIDGNVFSPVPARVANAGIKQVSNTNSAPKKGLSQGAIIGISVGVGVTAVLLSILIVLCLRNGWHKPISRADRDRLHSPLDARFGSTTITAPTNGAYNNPYATPRIDVKETTTDAFWGNETSTSTFTGPLKSMFNGSSAKEKPTAFEKPIKLLNKSQRRKSPASSVATIPIHHAYNQPSPTSFSRHSRQTASTSTTPAQSPDPRIQFHPGSGSNSPPFTGSMSLGRPDSLIGMNRDRSTLLAGVGNSNASQDGPAIGHITGPIVKVKHGARLDFDAAERERMERLAREKVAPNRNGSPKMDESPARSVAEQWPGNY